MRDEQRITGLYRLVTMPKVYEAIQDILGAQAARTRYFREWVQTDRGHDVLDIGCGPGVALEHIRYATYTGIDLNLAHVEEARGLGCANTTFYHGDVVEVAPKLTQSFDVVLSLGFLHHLNDEHVREVIEQASKMLKPQGRIYFLEPVWLPNQRFTARWLKRRDSGQHIRDRDAYRNLLKQDGFDLKVFSSNDLLRVPYDHFWARLERK